MHGVRGGKVRARRRPMLGASMILLLRRQRANIRALD